jgi:hypothetical protein
LSKQQVITVQENQVFANVKSRSIWQLDAEKKFVHNVIINLKLSISYNATVKLCRLWTGSKAFNLFKWALEVEVVQVEQQMEIIDTLTFDAWINVVEHPCNLEHDLDLSEFILFLLKLTVEQQFWLVDYWVDYFVYFKQLSVLGNHRTLELGDLAEVNAGSVHLAWNQFGWDLSVKLVIHVSRFFILNCRKAEVIQSGVLEGTLLVEELSVYIKVVIFVKVDGHKHYALLGCVLVHIGKVWNEEGRLNHSYEDVLLDLGYN